MVARTIRTGMDRHNGRILRGVAHAQQSVRDILATFKGTRIMELDYGANLRPLRGENLTAVNVLRAYSELVTAIHTQEPAVRVVRVQPNYLDGRAGALGFLFDMVFFTYGHLGDYSEVEGFQVSIPVTALARGTGALS